MALRVQAEGQRRNGGAVAALCEALPGPLEGARPASVHNPGITRRDRAAIEESAEVHSSWIDRDHWLGLLEGETEAHRLNRAAGYAERARRRRAVARRDGASEREVRQRALWYACRDKGQRERFDVVRACGDGRTMTVLCTACGVTSEQRLLCGHAIVCPECRARKIRKRRGRVGRARQIVLRDASRRGLLTRARPGGRHSEKLLTLTIPHREEHDVATRIAILFDAWPYFLKELNAWLRAEHGDRAEWMRDSQGRPWTPWFRNAEWTIGSDAHGHPHMHVWMLGPFLPHTAERDLVTGWWREALARVGFADGDGPLAQREALSSLVVDLRAIRDGRVEDGAGILTEVIKYMAKDLVAPGRYVDAETYARVYEGFDTHRAEQGARGFFGMAAEPCACPECEAVGSYLVRVASGPWRGSIAAHQAHGEARGPPPLAPLRHVRAEPAEPVHGDEWDAKVFAAELAAKLATPAAWLASRPHRAECRCSACARTRLRALAARNTSRGAATRA